MLSYRHAFHAGNFGDVLKHVVLAAILQHLSQKDKPYCYIDTHAGPGWVDLAAPYAQKNREYEGGVARLWTHQDLPPAVAAYLALVKTCNDGGTLRRYPGSPWLALHLQREGDRTFLFELHPTDYEILSARVADRRHVKALCADGLRDCVGLVPPAERRGLVFIDPSYEIKTDYRLAVETVQRLYRRFATGVYALWYPVIERRRVAQLERAVTDAGVGAARLFELSVRADGRGGMTGCGMIVINPPWTLAPRMDAALPYLAKVLGQDGGGAWRAVELASAAAVPQRGRPRSD